MRYRALGLMSGTSLDGLDIAYCEFILKDDEISYAIKKATTIPYTEELKQKIIQQETASAEEMFEFSSFFRTLFR